MPSDVTVFVVFNLEEIPTPLDISKAALHISREQPRWSIGAVGNHSFRLGSYDQLPVLVSFRYGPDVLEESQLIAMRSNAAASISQRLKRGSARFEFVWDMHQDKDVVPETATLIVSCAQALARLSKSVILVGGSRIVPDDVELDDGRAFEMLFPN